MVNLLKFALIAGILYYLIVSERLNFERLLLFGEHPRILFTLLAVLVFWIVPLTALRWWLLLRAIGLEVLFFPGQFIDVDRQFFQYRSPGCGQR